MKITRTDGVVGKAFRQQGCAHKVLACSLPADRDERGPISGIKSQSNCAETDSEGLSAAYGNEISY